MNKIVLKGILVSAVLSTVALPCAAQTTRPLGQKPTTVTEQPPSAVSSLVKTAYASDVCKGGRRRLWTETGWIVRRVGSCR